jgi:hypothetical protein
LSLLWPEATVFMTSDPGVGDRPELTRSDYDRLIRLLRASQANEEKESTTTCRELDMELHGISVRLDQMQQEDWRLNFMQRVLMSAICLTFIVLAYLLHTSAQTWVAHARVEGRVDGVDRRLVIMDKRFDEMKERLNDRSVGDKQ